MLAPAFLDSNRGWIGERAPHQNNNADRGIIYAGTREKKTYEREISRARD